MAHPAISFAMKAVLYLVYRFQHDPFPQTQSSPTVNSRVESVDAQVVKQALADFFPNDPQAIDDAIEQLISAPWRMVEAVDYGGLHRPYTCILPDDRFLTIMEIWYEGQPTDDFDSAGWAVDAGGLYESFTRQFLYDPVERRFNSDFGPAEGLKRVSLRGSASILSYSDHLRLTAAGEKAALQLLSGRRPFNPFALSSPTSQQHPVREPGSEFLSPREIADWHGVPTKTEAIRRRLERAMKRTSAGAPRLRFADVQTKETRLRNEAKRLFRHKAVIPFISDLIQ